MITAAVLPLRADEKKGAIATKKNPQKWENAKSKAVEKMGKHSAHAMQLAAKIYKEKGGEYAGDKPTAKKNMLKKWGKKSRADEVRSHEGLVSDVSLSSRMLELQMRLDAATTRMRTRGKKLPGKPCGGTYISAAYKCGRHYTNGNLNDEGKAAVQATIAKIKGKAEKEAAAPPVKKTAIAPQKSKVAIAQTPKAAGTPNPVLKPKAKAKDGSTQLRGTEKQVAWAEKIRASTVRKANEQIRQEIQEFSGRYSVAEGEAKRDRLKKAYAAEIATISSAKDWIDGRQRKYGSTEAYNFYDLDNLYDRVERRMNNERKAQPATAKKKGDRTPIERTFGTAGTSKPIKFYNVDISDIAASGKKNLHKSLVGKATKLASSTGGILSPLVVTSKDMTSYKMHGDPFWLDVSQSMKQANPRVEMARSFVAKARKEADAAIAQQSLSAKNQQTLPQSKSPNVAKKTQYFTVDVDDIKPRIPTSKFDKKAVGKMADLINEAGGLASPVLLKQTNATKYEVIAGDFDYAAISEAKRRNPVDFEMVNSFVVKSGDENLAANFKKLDSDRANNRGTATLKVGDKTVYKDKNGRMFALDSVECDRALTTAQKEAVLTEFSKLLKERRTDAFRRDRTSGATAVVKCGRGWQGTKPGCDRAKSKSAKQQQKIDQLRAQLINSEKSDRIEAGSVGEMNPADIKVNPAKFQYKRLSNSKGEVGSLSGVKTYDPNLAGIMQTWRDPQTGEVSVVNGHNRKALADRAGVKKVAVRMLDVPDAKSARAIGALSNIAEGRGDSLDSAKFFRDSGISREDLEKKGIPLREKIATEGIAISKLEDTLYRKAMSGDMPVERAAIIGAANLAPEQQRSLAQLVSNRSKRKEITNSVLRELVDTARSSATQSQTTMTLFGAEEIKSSLALEKAQLQAGIKRRLAREKKLFGTVGRSQSAKSLSKAGNQINVEGSQAVSQQVGQALDKFDRMKNLKGDVSDRINEAAKRIANGESLRTVESDLYQRILSEVRADAKKVAVKTKTGMAKIPGKPCGGSYISAAYKCGSHYTNGKLNAEGKAAAEKLAEKVRKVKGLSAKGSTKPQLAIALRPTKKKAQSTAAPIKDKAVASFMKGKITADSLKATVQGLKASSLDSAALRGAALSRMAEFAPSGSKSGDRLEAHALNNMKKSILTGIKPPADQQIANLKGKAAKARTAKSKLKHEANIKKLEASAKAFEPIKKELESASDSKSREKAIAQAKSFMAKSRSNDDVAANALYNAIAKDRYGWDSSEERSQKFQKLLDTQVKGLKDDISDGSWGYLQAKAGVDYISHAAGLGSLSGVGGSANLDELYKSASSEIGGLVNASKSQYFAGIGESPTKAQIKKLYKAAAGKAHPDAGGSAQDFDDLTNSYKAMLRRYNYDAYKTPSVGKGKKAPGTPCGNGWISAKYKCDPEKLRQATKRLKENKGKERDRYSSRLRKAKGIGGGRRENQMSDRLSKKLSGKEAALEKAENLMMKQGQVEAAREGLERQFKAAPDKPRSGSAGALDVLAQSNLNKVSKFKRPIDRVKKAIAQNKANNAVRFVRDPIKRLSDPELRAAQDKFEAKSKDKSLTRAERQKASKQWLAYGKEETNRMATRLARSAKQKTPANLAKSKSNVVPFAQKPAAKFKRDLRSLPLDELKNKEKFYLKAATSKSLNKKMKKRAQDLLMSYSSELGRRASENDD